MFVFNERARGATAFSLNPGKPVERLEQFEPQAEQIIMTPVSLEDECGSTPNHGSCDHLDNSLLCAYLEID